MRASVRFIGRHALTGDGDAGTSSASKIAFEGKTGMGLCCIRKLHDKDSIVLNRKLNLASIGRALQTVTNAGKMFVLKI